MYIYTAYPPMWYRNSVKHYAKYLTKENAQHKGEANEESYTYFFNKDSDKVERKEVVANLDRKGHKLKQKDAKYYSVFINPSVDELKKINNDPKKLQEYTRNVMKEYANNFNRKGINEDTIVWYAKVEKLRKLRQDNAYVKHNLSVEAMEKFAKNTEEKIHKTGEGTYLLNHMKDKIERNGKYYVNKKTGDLKLLKQQPPKHKGFELLNNYNSKYVRLDNQSHIHVIVSRMDKTNTISISPMAKAKRNNTILNGKEVSNGFDRVQFKKKSESLFDIMFNYNRKMEDTIEYHIKKDNPKLRQIQHTILNKSIFNTKEQLKAISEQLNINITMSKKSEVIVDNIKKQLMNKLLRVGGISQSIALINLFRNRNEIEKSIKQLVNIHYKNYSFKQVTQKDIEQEVLKIIYNGGNISAANIANLAGITFAPHVQIVNQLALQAGSKAKTISII